jgi:DNA (cytosine-5)-methyltransferase 1
VITYGSVCSGIESATVAWAPLGMGAMWFSEIEAFPCAVLTHHWPNVPNLGDMTKLAGMVRAGFVPAPDILVGGTPCQAYSVAGMREGLDDERGQLTIEYARLFDAIDEQRERPAACCWENVPGVLSSKDNAFGVFLATLCGEDEELQPPRERWANAGYVFGPQRSVAWRVLDAQYFGVAQRRKRVFVVASARDDFDPASVLFEPEGVRRDSPPRREHRAPEHTGGAAIVAYDMLGFGQYGKGLTASTLKARDNKDWTDLVLHEGRVRGVMPFERERLQGFPDDHTRVPYRNKTADDCPAGPRYKAIGNSKAVPVVQWVGRRIQKELSK